MVRVDITNWKQLEAEINKRIAKALQNEVAETVKSVMVDKVQTEVYDVYSPKMYERQGDQGGLSDRDNIDAHMIDDNTLSVRNTRHDGDKDVAAIVETGLGYAYNFEFNGIARPFTAETVEELKNTNEHVYALYKGLQRQGLKMGK